MNFDWYAATVDARPEEAIGEMVAAFEGSTYEGCRPLGGYRFDQAARVRREGVTLATVMWDGPGSRGDSCFVQATGQQSPPVAQFLRGWMPSHRVSRSDVAEDYSGPGTWERLSTLSLAIADRHAVKVEHMGDWHRGEAGRSIYLGGRMSVVREVVYEKGKQLGGDPDHVRVELRVKPGTRDGKVHAAQLQPAEFYGASVWSADLGRELQHPEVARLSLGTVYREGDIARARRALLQQYGRTLRGLESECGSWAGVGEWIGDHLK